MHSVLIRTTRTTILTGAILLQTAGTATAQSGSWLRIGPPRTPEQYLQDERDYRNRVMQPDAGPWPPSYWHWPTLREALDEYGWFGRKASRNAYNPSAAAPQVPIQPIIANVDAPAFIEPARPESAHLRVRVPADARVWINGAPTTSAGSTRLFVSPPLQPDRQYRYELRAEWRENGAEVTRKKQVDVFAGARQTVDWAAEEVTKRP